MIVRRTVQTALIGAILAVIAGTGPALAAENTLKVCLEDGSPPYSYKFGPRKGGFDLILAERLAAKLGRDLKVQWYESEDDDEVVPIFEVNALLSAGFCDLVGGMALVKSNLGKPVQPSAALPEWDGMKRSERGTRVNMGELIATAPYLRAGLTVILGADKAGLDVKRLSDLKGMRVGAEVTTVSSALVMRYQSGLLAEKSEHFTPGTVFNELEAGNVDAVLAETHRFERHRTRNPDTKLTGTGYSHSIAYNIAFAALKGSKAPISAINKLIESMVNSGEMAAVAKAANISYFPPRKPLIFNRITPGMLTMD